MSQDKCSYAFSEEDVESYVPTAEFIDYCVALDLLGLEMDSGSALNKLRPGLPSFDDADE